MNGNRKRIIDQYDYENAFVSPVNNLDEIFIEEMMKDRLGLHYAVKSVRSGKIFELEIYPVFKSKKDIPEKNLDNGKAQNDLNERNSRKRFIRVANTNFGEGDFWITLTYAEHCHPKTEKEARKNIGNYMRRVNRLRKKYGLENARYIYIMEWEGGADGIRCHYHILMEGGIDRNILEDMWQYAIIKDSSRIHPNEEGIAGLVIYMADKKKYKGKRRWIPSKNLKQPAESVSHSRIRSRRQVENMVRDYEEIRSFFEKEKKWKKYRFLNAEVMYNRFNAAFYIHITARERSSKEDESGRKNYHFGSRDGTAGGIGRTGDCQGSTGGRIGNCNRGGTV